jgi:hypothetical protein
MSERRGHCNDCDTEVDWHYHGADNTSFDCIQELKKKIWTLVDQRDTTLALITADHNKLCPYKRERDFYKGACDSLYDVFVNEGFNKVKIIDWANWYPTARRQMEGPEPEPIIHHVTRVEE